MNGLAEPTKRAMVEELLKLSGLFRQNAALKHGVPEADITRLGPSAPSGTEVKPVDKPSSGVPPVPVAAGWPAWLKAALAAGAIGTAGLGGAGIMALFRGGDTTIEQADPSGSLLQHLEDHGLNVPPAWEK